MRATGGSEDLQGLFPISLEPVMVLHSNSISNDDKSHMKNDDNNNSGSDKKVNQFGSDGEIHIGFEDSAGSFLEGHEKLSKLLPCDR